MVKLPLNQHLLRTRHGWSWQVSGGTVAFNEGAPFPGPGITTRITKMRACARKRTGVLPRLGRGNDRVSNSGRLARRACDKHEAYRSFQHRAVPPARESGNSRRRADASGQPQELQHSGPQEKRDRLPASGMLLEGLVPAYTRCRPALFGVTTALRECRGRRARRDWTGGFLATAL